MLYAYLYDIIYIYIYISLVFTTRLPHIGTHNTYILYVIVLTILEILKRIDNVFIYTDYRFILGISKIYRYENHVLFYAISPSRYLLLLVSR